MRFRITGVQTNQKSDLALSNLTSLCDWLLVHDLISHIGFTFNIPLMSRGPINILLQF